MSKRATSSRSARSPPSRTAPTISATASLTDAGAGASARTRGRRGDRVAADSMRSSRTQLLQHRVDRRRLELVRDRVGDQPRGRGEQLLADDEVVLAQRRAGRREVDDRLDEARSAAPARPSP